MSKLGKEYENEEAEKAKKRKMELEDSRRDYSTTLDIKHERRVENYKNYINKLSSKVDNNQENYVKYSSSIPNRIRTYQDICYNPRLSPNPKKDDSQANSSYEVAQKLNSESYRQDQGKESPRQLDYHQFYDDNLNYKEKIKSQTIGNSHDIIDSGINQPYYYNESGQSSIEIPYQFESLPPNSRESDEKVSSLPSNIIAHNNSKHLEDLYNKHKNNHIALNKSVLEFNIEAAKIKQEAILMEEENRRRMMNERIWESEQTKMGALETNFIKQCKQINYKALLDFQAALRARDKNSPEIRDSFKYYEGKRGCNLGVSLLSHNPIINPVNSYSFAQYYIRKNHLN